MKNHEETIGSQFCHVILPLIVTLIFSGVSLSADICCENDTFYFQRSGALLAAVSIYIGFHEARKRYLINGTTLKLQTNIWYQWLALFAGILGTIVWAYGDLPFK